MRGGSSFRPAWRPARHVLRDLPLLSRHRFFMRLVRAVVIGFVVLLVSLGAGMVGYHVTEGLSWIDSYANAAMILSGMGPLSPLPSDAGKLFAGSCALFSGLTMITVVGVVVAPIAHRALHRFHLESDEKEDDAGSDERR